MNCDHSFEKLRDLLRADRSIRRFVQKKRIDGETLERLVELTRFCASGRNAQPLRYRAVWTEDECAKVFPHLAWAGYYTDWAGPEEGERPAAYLVQCLDTDVAKGCLCDDGIQLQALTLGAAALGIGGCIIKSFNAKAVSEALGIDPRYQPLYVLALGHPAEEAVITEIGP
ncbi:MAG: nitroreductase family protein, partial [Duncaniella sp.]|nr:nitroreductase family protein [Duncaniella sp.]